MQNLTTTKETFSATTTISKSFTTVTEKGYEIIVTAYRRVIEVTATGYESPIYYGVSCKGQEFGHHDMDRSALADAIDVINTWGHRL